jgi:lysophospholipase L1-like esterase
MLRTILGKLKVSCPGRICLGVIVGLCLLELTLQIAAVVTWLVYRPAAVRPHANERVILCIGDSYTFGIGASATEHSYPAVLEHLLRQGGDSWRVVNAGWPGRDSQDAMLMLNHEFTTLHPSLVYIQIGANDKWSRPDRLAPGETDGGGMRFRWRTARLAALAANAGQAALARLREEVPKLWRAWTWRWRHSPGSSPSGIWAFQNTMVHFDDDGMLRFGGATLRWQTHENQLEIFPYNGSSGQKLSLEWTLREGGLFIQGGPYPTGLLLEPVTGACAAMPRPTAGMRELERNGNVAMVNRDWRTSQDQLRAALAAAGPAERPRILAALVRAYAGEGNRAQAVAELGKLHDELEAAGSPEGIGCLFVFTAEEIGANDQALAAARQLVGRYPSNPWFERTIAWQSFEKRDLATATTAIDRAVEITVNDNGPRALFFSLRSTIQRTLDPKKSMESALRAYQINRDQGALRLLLDMGGTTFSPALMTACLDELQAPADVRREIRLVMDQVLHPSTSDSAPTLAAHLRQMVAAVRSSGSELVLMSYPFPSDINDVARRVARETGAGWIDVEAEIAKRLQTTRREDLYVADGHLSDRGYAIVAALVADDVRRRSNHEEADPARLRWRLECHDHGSAAALAFSDARDPVMRVEISRAGTPVRWHIQLTEPGLSLEANATYEFAFRARSDAPQTIAYGVNQAHAPWQALWGCTGRSTSTGRGASSSRPSCRLPRMATRRYTSIWAPPPRHR